MVRVEIRIGRLLTATRRFMASSFSRSLFESSCLRMLRTLSSPVSKYAAPPPRVSARSLVCSERVS